MNTSQTKTLPKISKKKIAEMQEKIDLLQSEMDVLLGNTFEFSNIEEARKFYEKNY